MCHNNCCSWPDQPMSSLIQLHVTFHACSCSAFLTSATTYLKDMPLVLTCWCCWPAASCRRQIHGEREDDVAVPPLFRTALVWGLFMGVSSNLRYQVRLCSRGARRWRVGMLRTQCWLDIRGLGCMCRALDMHSHVHVCLYTLNTCFA